jgi:arylsulfate sulfotransferase
MRTLLVLGLSAAVLALPSHSMAASGHLPGGPSVTVNGATAGPTPFISMVDLTFSPPGSLRNIGFMIEPKVMSVTRPITASYSRAYLESHGRYNALTGHLVLPVFGLYAAYNNAVTLTVDFTQGPSKTTVVPITTAPWSDPTGGAYTNPTIVQPRTNATNLSFDYVMLKGFAAAITPIIIDTDGAVRWVGTAGIGSISSIFYDNGIYLSNGSGITREELDGTFAFVADYSGQGVTGTGHHNYDRGRDGILVECNTTTGVESTVIEVSATGQVLHTWNIANIVADAMTAGGDNPSGFVRAPDDWLHNNATTYDRRGNSLIVSGRENFVIAIDYDANTIQWILGDSTKAWYQYPSLRKFALTLAPGSLPPIGQHAVSMTGRGNLLLFDDGRASLNQSPIGEDRTYSAPREYDINARKMTAVETWHYLSSPPIYSAYCSSVYEDGRGDHLIDYTLNGDVIGLDASDQMVFHYNYSTAFFCGTSWNAIPIHLENVSFQ